MSDISYQEVITQIKDRLDIIDVVSKYVILKKSGGKVSAFFGAAGSR